MLATSWDSESWRRPAAITSSWEWFSTMAEGRSPSGTGLLLRQCLACGRDSKFSRSSRAQSIDVLQYVIPPQEVMTHINVGVDKPMEFNVMDFHSCHRWREVRCVCSRGAS